MNQAELPFAAKWHKSAPSPAEQQRQAWEDQRRVQEAQHQARLKESSLYRELDAAVQAGMRQFYEKMGWTYPDPTLNATCLPVTEPMRLLGLAHPFTREDIASAWRARAAAVHPDKGGSAEKFIKVTRARDELLRNLGACV